MVGGGALIELRIGETQKALSDFDWWLQVIQTVAQVVGTLVWPLTIATVIYWFRSPIAEVIKNISKFSMGSVGVEVKAALEGAEEAAAQKAVEDIKAEESASVTHEAGSNSEAVRSKRAWRLGAENAENLDLSTIEFEGDSGPDLFGVIERSWSPLRQSLEQVYDEFYVRSQGSDAALISRLPTSLLARRLVRNNTISPSVGEIILELSRIRSELMKHGFRSLTASEAYRFRTLSNVVMQEFRGVTEQNQTKKDSD